MKYSDITWKKKNIFWGKLGEKVMQKEKKKYPETNTDSLFHSYSYT